MNLYQLKYFQAVCTYHSLSAAAKYLHISQPSLSNAIKELENSFGVALFKRQHSGMVLTHEGEVLLSLSGDILNRSEHMEKIMNALGKKRNFLRLGVPPMIGSLILPKIYAEFVVANPDIELEIIEGDRKELMEKLQEDTVDMIFLSHSRLTDSTLASQSVAKFEIVCCVPQGSPFAQFRSISPKDLAETPLVLFKNSFFQTEEIKKWFSSENVTPKILLQTQQLSTMQSLISKGIATGFMFRHLIENNRNFISIPLHNPIFPQVSLIWKKDAYLFEGMKKFRTYASAISI